MLISVKLLYQFQLEREMHMSISESYFDVTLFASVIRSYMFAHLIDDFWDSECFSSQSMLLRSVGLGGPPMKQSHVPTIIDKLMNFRLR
jgi:hypothetical protein